MVRKLIGTSVLAGALFLPALSRAEDINSIFKRVNDLVAAKNYSKAIEELGWATKELEKLNSQQIQGFLPDQLAGFVGKKVEANNALGFSNIERSYEKPGTQTRVKVSITGGAGGAAAGGLGGLAAFGKMAALMGAGAGGQDTFRINGRTATLEKNEDGKSAHLTVFLDSGSMLSLEMDNGADDAKLREMAEALDINKLDNYLRGQG
ncbi:MAG: hypothetical protein K1X79_12575 [Oligoflexia bacterium]|nr:hypothetical protein [Oligoflexia bacterium]